MDMRHDSQPFESRHRWGYDGRPVQGRQTRSLSEHSTDERVGLLSTQQREPLNMDQSSDLDCPQSVRASNELSAYATRPFAASTPIMAGPSTSTVTPPQLDSPRSPDSDDSGPELDNAPKLPSVHDFSIDGILEAIQPDIQGTIDAIAEILGRSRYSLANEYGAHMPPQGEIRAGRGFQERRLLPVEEATVSDDHLATDPVVIVGEDASLIDGSHAGSVAYDLLERIRAAARQRSDLRSSRVDESEQHPIQTIPSQISALSPTREPVTGRRSHANHLALLQGHADRRVSNVINAPSAAPLASPLTVHESNRNLPLQDFEHADMVGALVAAESQTQSLSMISDLQSLMSWLYHSAEPHRQAVSTATQPRATDSLRGILDRHEIAVESTLEHPSHSTDNDMYGAS